jgi:hypothetical protein
MLCKALADVPPREAERRSSSSATKKVIGPTVVN